MTTSGTVSQTNIDVATIIEHAFRRAGCSPAEQTPDALISAQENLYFYLSQLANAGTSLWAIDKLILGTVIGLDNYSAGVGAIDIQKALYRTINLAATGGTATSSAGGTAANAFNQLLTSACTQVSAGGNIKYAFTSNVKISNVGVMTNGNQVYNLVFEYSLDNVNWNTALATGSQSYTGGTWTYYDIASPSNAQYFRVRESSIGILNITQLVFNTITSEIQIARINSDIYFNLPNKTFQSRQILQYWMDRQLPAPLMRVWPVSNYSFDQVIIWRKRYIQDVGRNMTNTIEIPQRWIEAVVTELAIRLLLELPKADKQRYTMLKAEAAAATNAAQQEERDRSPITLSPNISCYTR